jgi:hypothetical protein
MRAIFLVAAALASAALVAGCLEAKCDFNLNPDGTGKVVGDMMFIVQPPFKKAPSKSDTAETAKPPEEEMNEIVTSIIRRSSGIDAWKDVAFSRAPDGRIHFKGTAYFKDLSKVKIWPDDRTRLSFGPDGTGGITLILNRAKPAADSKPAKQMSAEEIAKRMKLEREKYQTTKAPLTMDVMGVKAELVFRAPGTLEESRGMEQRPEALAYVVEGAKVVQAADAQVGENAFWRDLLMSGKSFNLKDLLNQKVFALKGEAWAKWKGPFKARFDYAAEADAAKKGQQDMMRRLGLEKAKDSSTSTKPPAPTTSEIKPIKEPQPATKDAPPAKKDTTPAKKTPDPSSPKVPRVPVPDPTQIPVPILPF